MTVRPTFSLAPAPGYDLWSNSLRVNGRTSACACRIANTESWRHCGADESLSAPDGRRVLCYAAGSRRHGLLQPTERSDALDCRQLRRLSDARADRRCLRPALCGLAAGPGAGARRPLRRPDDLPRRAAGALRRPRDLRCRGDEPVPGAGGDPLAGDGVRVLRLLQELQPAVLLRRPRHRLFAGGPRSHAARPGAAAPRLAVPVPDRVSRRHARVDTGEHAQPAVPGTVEHGRQHPDDVRRGRGHLLLSLGRVRDDVAGVRARRAGLRPADETAAEPACLRIEPAGQPRRCRPDLHRELPVDAAHRLVRDVVRGDTAAARAPAP